MLGEPEQPIDWLVESLLGAGTIGYLAGDPKAGKSWLALYLGLCVSTGTPVFEKFKVPTKRRVLLIQEEDSKPLVKRRLEQLIEGHGVEKPDSVYFRAMVRTGVKLDAAESQEALRAELAKNKFDVVIIDVFNKVHSKDENSQKEMSQVMLFVEQMRREFGCAILILHHFRKTTMGGSRKGAQMLRGTSVLAGWAENSLYLTATAKERRIEVESKLCQLEPFAYSMDETKDSTSGKVGIRFQYKGEAGLVRINAALERLETAIKERFAEEGEAGCTIKALHLAAGMSENSVKKYGDVLCDAGRVRLGMTTNAHNQAAKCYLPIREVATVAA